MRTLILTFLVGLFAALSSPAKTAATADKKAEFETLLKQAQVALDGGRYKEAKEILVTKLAEHKDADYAKAKLDAIRADVKTCSFRIVHPKKSFKDISSGEVTSYDQKTGQAKITYDRKAKEAKKPREKFPGDDIETAHGSSVWKFPFEGPFTIEFSGKALGERCPIVMLCVQDEDAFTFELDRKGLTCLGHIEHGAYAEIASATNMYNVLRPYSLKVAVRDTQIEVLLDGKRVVMGEKSKGRFGEVSYSQVANLERIELNGKISTAWVEGQIEERSKADLAEFEKTYDAKADLPEWLR